MKTIFFKLIPTTLLLVVLLFSCSKETSKIYPNEITLENWEEFLEAPDDVIEKLISEEQKARKLSPLSEERELESNARTTTIGLVQAWDGTTLGSNWRGISNVVVSNSWTGTTTNSLGQFAFNAFGINPICMNYNTPALNGVSPLDLVLINRHINGTSLFDNVGLDSDAARRYVAADVDNNGVINSIDANAISSLVFTGSNVISTTSLPRNNMCFVPKSYLKMSRIANNPYALASLQNNCQQVGDYITYAIKIGDISGDFSF